MYDAWTSPQESIEIADTQGCRNHLWKSIVNQETCHMFRILPIRIPSSPGLEPGNCCKMNQSKISTVPEIPKFLQMP